MRSLLMITFLSVASYAQSQNWQWPDSSKNLQVLPPNTRGAELRKTMSEFINGLGVRCVYCHVGEDNKSLSTFDFVSDAKETKNTARKMMMMVKVINETYIAHANENKSKPLDVTCVTCHRGAPLPERIEDILASTYATSGIDSVKNHYRSLRSAYYGSFTYDFREGVLLRTASRIKKATDPSDAIALVELNNEHFPNSVRTLITLATLHQEAKHIDVAKSYAKKVLEIEPGNEAAKKIIESLK